MKKFYTVFLSTIWFLTNAVPSLAQVNGLTGQYFNDPNLTSLKMTRIDSLINFRWGIKPPGPPIGVTNFSVRWTGRVQPKYSETYQFLAKGDGGVRLWIGGHLLVDNWAAQIPTWQTRSITLVAGRKYDLKLEHCRIGAAGVLALVWSSPSQPQGVVPANQLFFTAAPSPSVPSAQPVLPTSLSNKPFQWQIASPSSQGIDGTKLAIMRDVLASRGTKALLIMRNDNTVMEWYAPGGNLSTRFGVSSMAKGLVGGLSLLLALDDGRLTPADYAAKYIAEWRKDAVKSKIRVSHLASHTSGIEDAMGPDPWMQAFWKRVPDPFSISINEAPVLFTPGTDLAYSNPGFAALGYVVTASLRGQPQSDIRSLLKSRIMDGIGVPEQEWSVGYSKPSQLDGMTLYATWGGASYTARAAAKLGRLMLRKGNWDGRQLASASSVTRSLTPVDPRFCSTLGWWTNLSHAFSTSLPSDSFVTAGDGHQILLVIPSLNLIVVRLGYPLMDQQDFWAGLEEYLLEPLMASLGVVRK